MDENKNNNANNEIEEVKKSANNKAEEIKNSANNKAEEVKNSVDNKAKENKKTDDKKGTAPNKKTIGIIAAAAVLVIAAVLVCIFCFGKDNDDGAKDTKKTASLSGDASGDAAELPDDVNNAIDGSVETAFVTDDSGNTVTDDSGNAVTEAVKTEDVTHALPPDTGVVVVAPDNDSFDPDDGMNVVTDVPSVQIVEQSDDKNLWPSEYLPDGIPACKYISIDNCNMTEEETHTNWDISFVASEDEYYAWISELKNNGFRQSKEYPLFYANGKCVLSVSTERDGNNLWVEMMVDQSAPVDYEGDVFDGVFPEFPVGDATLEYWALRYDHTKITVQYACSTDWNALIAAYKSKLSAAGFTVDENQASKSALGATYTVYYGGEMCSSAEQLVYARG